MCWSINVSLAAALVHGTTYLVARHQRPPEYRSYLLFTLFYTTMELFQALQWAMGDVETGCTSRNQGFTIIAYILIWIQPLLFVKIGDKTRFHTVRIRLQYGARLATITFWYALLLLGLGLTTEPSWVLPNSNYGPTTCTVIGPYGHLGWQFAPISIVYGPTHFVYVALIVTTIMFYPTVLKLTIGLGWLGTLFVSLYLVGTTIDLPAFWCFLSLFADGPILIRCLRYTRK